MVAELESNQRTKDFFWQKGLSGYTMENGDFAWKYSHQPGMKYTFPDVMQFVENFGRDVLQHRWHADASDVSSLFSQFKDHVTMVFADAWTEWAIGIVSQLNGQDDLVKKFTNQRRQPKGRGKGFGGKGFPPRLPPSPPAWRSSTTPWPSTGTATSARPSRVNAAFAMKAREGFQHPHGVHNYTHHRNNDSGDMFFNVGQEPTRPSVGGGLAKEASETFETILQNVRSKVEETVVKKVDQNLENTFKDIRDFVDTSFRNVESKVEKIFAQRVDKEMADHFAKVQNYMDKGFNNFQDKLNDMVYKKTDHNTFMTMMEDKFEKLMQDHFKVKYDRTSGQDNFLSRSNGMSSQIADLVVKLEKNYVEEKFKHLDFELDMVKDKLRHVTNLRLPEYMGNPNHGEENVVSERESSKKFGEFFKVTDQQKANPDDGLLRHLLSALRRVE